MNIQELYTAARDYALMTLGLEDLNDNHIVSVDIERKIAYITQIFIAGAKWREKNIQFVIKDCKLNIENKIENIDNS